MSPRTVNMGGSCDQPSSPRQRAPDQPHDHESGPLWRPPAESRRSRTPTQEGQASAQPPADGRGSFFAVDQNHLAALRQARPRLVQIRGCFVVLERRPETAAYRRGARSFASTPRRLLLLVGPHTDSARHPHHVFSTLAPGSLLSRREAMLGLRRSAEPRLSRHAAHRPFDLLYLRPGGHLVRAIRLQAGWFVHFAAALVQAKKLHIVRGPSSNFAIRHMAGKGF